MRSNQLLPVRILGLVVLGAVFSGPLFRRDSGPQRISGETHCGPCQSLPPSPATRRKSSPTGTSWSKASKRLEGLFPLYYDEKEQKLFMEINQDQYDKELILPIAIARGAGSTFLGGDTLNFGDQWLISFHRAGDRLLVIRHNVRFRAEAGSPQADAVKVSYTDSVLKALPIKSEKKAGNWC